MSAKDLIALAKAQPGRLNFGSGGIGAPTHLAAELFQILTGTRMTHLPFKGARPRILAVMGGDIDFAFGSVPATLHHAKARRLRALAVSTTQRTQAAPDIPTLVESGVPGFEVTSWYAFFGPSKLPKEIINRLHTDIGRIAADPEFHERLVHEGGYPEQLTLERFAQFIRTGFRSLGEGDTRGQYHGELNVPIRGAPVIFVGDNARAGTS